MTLIKRVDLLEASLVLLITDIIDVAVCKTVDICDKLDASLGSLVKEGDESLRVVLAVLYSLCKSYGKTAVRPNIYLLGLKIAELIVVPDSKGEFLCHVSNTFRY